MKTRIFNVLLWIFFLEIIGFFLGLITQQNLDWYAHLNKSALTPPSLVFSIVWPILYALLAIVGATLWTEQRSKTFQMAWYSYLAQLLMNWLWTPLFFYLHWIGVSFIWLIVLTLLTIVTAYLLRLEKKKLSILLWPYIVWLIFASYLNGVIWIFN